MVYIIARTLENIVRCFFFDETPIMLHFLRYLWELCESLYQIVIRTSQRLKVVKMVVNNTFCSRLSNSTVLDTQHNQLRTVVQYPTYQLCGADSSNAYICCEQKIASIHSECIVFIHVRSHHLNREQKLCIGLNLIPVYTEHKATYSSDCQILQYQQSSEHEFSTQQNNFQRHSLVRLNTNGKVGNRMLSVKGAQSVSVFVCLVYLMGMLPSKAKVAIKEI